MHFPKLPDHPKHGLKKDIYQRLEWLKTRFEAFVHASRPPEKKKNFTSGVVKSVKTWLRKRYFLASEVVKNVF
jgi:hypothetical protein